MKNVLRPFKVPFVAGDASAMADFGAKYISTSCAFNLSMRVGRASCCQFSAECCSRFYASDWRSYSSAQVIQLQRFHNSIATTDR